ncbi:MAG: hypothetical protein WC322_02310 [Candidatus Paceibacterota bacterium]|jgi:uncharacterized protein (DUF697 family)
MNTNTDPWYLSKRIYAAVVMVIALIASLFGLDLGEETQSSIVEAFVAIAAGVSALLAVWSKIREAKKAKAEK